MCQNSCNDYSLLTANTGIATISVANNNLNNSGSLIPVLTASAMGTIVKSVTIKAAGPVTAGMVRLYIGVSAGASVLYKEIPIPTTPELNATPTPAPVLPTFEIKLDGGLKLQPDRTLYASTQNGQTFNIIAEGVNWTYPSSLPATCCNFRQEEGVTGVGAAVTANANLDGSGNIATVFTATGSANGCLIKSITIKALQSTNEGMVRLFIKDGAGTYALMREIYIPQTTQSAFQPSFKFVIDEEFHIESGFVLGASTQLTQSFGITVEAVNWSYPIS